VAFNLDVPPPEYIETDAEARELLRLATRKVEEDPESLVGFDTETHGKTLPLSGSGKKPLDWMNDTVIFWSLSFETDRYRRWCLQQQHFQMFAGFLENPNLWMTAWNAKYDGHVSWNSGINIWETNVIDGLALQALYDENRRSNSLKTVAKDHCNLAMTPYGELFKGCRDINGRVAVEYKTSLLDLPIDLVVNYASYDAYACLRAAEFLIDELKQISLGSNTDRTMWDHFLDVELDFTEVLWRMERRGMNIDLDHLNAQIPKIDKSIAKLEREINRTAGQVVSMKSAGGKAININSPAQLAKLFFGSKKDGGMGLTPVKMTRGGATLPQPSVDKDVMAALEETTELAAMIVKCRSLQKTRSTYLVALRDMAAYFKDGRIHPQFNQFGARTGRLSTRGPNSQNFPRPDGDEWGIREAFIAPKGKKLIVADYGQLEMRIMADQSGDKVMIKAIKEGKDLHSFTASRMTPGVTYEDVVSAKKAESPNPKQKLLVRLRQDAKPVGFGIIYGAGPPTISQNIKIPDEDIDRKLEEMPAAKLSRKVKQMMKRNPLLTEDQAHVKVARYSIAADKIEAYFGIFPRVKAFMDYVPNLCRDTRFTDFPSEMDPAELAELKKVKEDDAGRLCDGRLREWGFVQTLFGRYRRLEDINHSNRMLRGHAEREAVNTKIQGTAADIAKAAMLRVEQCPKLNRMGAILLNQIHDELVLEVPKEHAVESGKLVKEYMEHPLGKGTEALCVSIPVDLVICDRWSEGK